MNWLLIAVICIIAWNVVRGYTRGVLRMVYSLAAWIVMLAASTMAAPYVRDQILSQTGIEPVILNGIEKQIAAQGQKPQAILIWQTYCCSNPEHTTPYPYSLQMPL